MIIFDEKQHAEKMLKKGFLTKHKNVFELYILAKYYYSIELTPEQVKENIVSYCEKYIEHFNIDEWYKIINKVIKSTSNTKLKTNIKVEIKKSEMDTIDNIKKENERKVAFSLLVLYKYYGHKKFEVSIEDLYRLSKLNLSSQSKLKILQSLTSSGLIDINMGGKRWVTFAEKSGEAVLAISDFEDFIYEYFNYFGDSNFLSCHSCLKAIKVTNNKKKYCKRCAEKIKRNQNKIADSKYRTKKRENRTCLKVNDTKGFQR